MVNTDIYVPRHGISNNEVCATSKGLDKPAHTRSLIRAFASRMNILWVLNYWLNIICNFLAYSKKESEQACLSLHISKYHIVVNHMLRLVYYYSVPLLDISVHYSVLNKLLVFQN